MSPRIIYPDDHVTKEMIRAVKRGDIESLKVLLTLPNSDDEYPGLYPWRDDKGFTLVEYAVNRDDLKTVEFLLDNGCGVSGLDSSKSYEMTDLLRSRIYVLNVKELYSLSYRKEYDLIINSISIESYPYEDRLNLLYYSLNNDRVLFDLFLREWNIDEDLLLPLLQNDDYNSLKYIYDNYRGRLVLDDMESLYENVISERCKEILVSISREMIEFIASNY